MHLTLHLTRRCNLRCRYCYAADRQTPADVDPGADMTVETALAAIAQQDPTQNVGVVFFGGEPLLRKDLIADIVAGCRARFPDRAFHFKTTTNGVLLDDAFLDFAEEAGLHIALSYDGVRTAHDAFRVDADGVGSHATVDVALAALLKRRPYSPVMMVVNPETLDRYFDGVVALRDKGARYVIVSLNHAAAWTDADLRRLRKVYLRFYDWILGLYRKGERFYFSPFEKIIGERVIGGDFGWCRAGERQISVDADGTFYPCVQFAGRTEYAIGSAATGLDTARRDEILAANHACPAVCGGCALHGRCHNRCACLNLQCGGDFTQPPPLLCERERLLIPLADKLAGQLFDEQNPLFLRRHTDPLYPVMSFLEDLAQ